MSQPYRLVAEMRGGQWTARAVHLDTGERFGIEVVADTEQDATARLAGWLAWQEEHTAALGALQRAERAYHRSVAEHAFAGAGDAGAGAEQRSESLRAVDGARARLDVVRARCPR